MTDRQRTIITEILRFLDMLSGGQAVDTLIHSQVNVRLEALGQVRASLTEFDTALQHCDGQRWVIGVPDLLGKTKWSLSDQGKAAHAQLK